MIIIALIYVAVAVLLIAGAVLFFARALRLLSGKTQPKPVSKLDFNVPLSEQVGDVHKRSEIIEMLERQFHSSPLY
jgi:hypothetical protein